MDFQGAQAEYRKLYTGLVDVSLLAVNPTKEDFLRLTGEELPYEPKYVGTDKSGKPYFNLAFLTHVPETDIYPVVNFMLQNSPEESKAGKLKFYDPSSGYYSYFTPSLDELVTRIEENPKMKWVNTANLEPLKSGKEKLNIFVQKLIKFNPKAKDVDWETDNFLKNFGTWENICDGKIDGFNKLVAYTQANDNKVRILLAVRKTVKEKEGETKTYFNQDVITNSIVFAREGNTAPGKYEKVQNDVKRAMSDGANWSNKLFTLDFQPFEEIQCINYTPEPGATVAEKPVEAVDWTK